MSLQLLIVLVCVNLQACKALASHSVLQTLHCCTTPTTPPPLLSPSPGLLLISLLVTPFCFPPSCFFPALMKTCSIPSHGPNPSLTPFHNPLVVAPHIGASSIVPIAASASFAILPNPLPTHCSPHLRPFPLLLAGGVSSFALFSRTA